MGPSQVAKVFYESCAEEDDELDKLEDGNKGIYLTECEG